MALFSALEAKAEDAVFSLRGQNQILHLYGARGGIPVIVSSGDGGWHGLAPHIAEFLSSRGYFAVGVDSKAYLESFTAKGSHLTTSEVPKDYADIVAYAARSSTSKPVLIGVSEGAGLSVLAATSKELQPLIAGVLALGLPDENELAWRTRDAIIWFTKKVPNEPTFRVTPLISSVSPVPLAVIHSTQDEFMSVEDEQKMFALAKEPKRIWILPAKDHSFKDQRPALDKTVTEALVWMQK